MKTIYWIRFSLGLFGVLFFVGGLTAQQHIYPPQKELWQADSLGNHRAVIHVAQKVEQVTVAIDWRNRNIRSDQKVYVVDSASNQLVKEVLPVEMTPERGVVTFSTSGRKGIYYVYYLPYKINGRRNYPDVDYLEKKKNFSSGNSSKDITDSKIAQVLRLESVDMFNSNFPMEVIATKKELEDFKSRYEGKDYLVFPEKRDYPIRMKDFLPQKWVESNLSTSFEDDVKIGENFTFQLGVWAFEKSLEDIDISFSNLEGERGDLLPSDKFTCFNKDGIDYTGSSFTKTVNIEKGKVQALWCGVTISDDLVSGRYSGTVTITPGNSKPTVLPIHLVVSDEKVQRGGIDEPWKQTRLNWLNSTLAQENTVIAPYVPVQVSGTSISLLGRKVELGPSGLPAQVKSYFTEEMTSITKDAKNILTAPFSLQFIQANGQNIDLSYDGPTFLKQESGKVTWQAMGNSPEISMEVNGSLEFDGFANFEIKVIAQQDLDLKDIALEIPMNNNSSKYILGMGYKGGARPDRVDWNWDVANKNQDGWWLGDVNSGMQVSLRDEHYERPLNTNFYLQKPLVLPSSWGNENKGGIKINRNANTVMVNNYSGSRFMKSGETLYYNFTLLITPFHPINTDAQWSERYYHAYNPIDSVLKSGANIINVHHANEINPYINYPFIATKEMKAYIDAAHSKNLKVKIYNTVREVSNRLYELYPLRSLNNEVFSKGSGGGYSWLQEHLQDNYIAAWYVPRFKDAAIINSGMNRWHNYYVEGMNWLVQNIGIDGIYLDDVAFDRITMKRIKRVLTQDGHSGLIDLHSANQYNKRDGFNNSANLYMEHFPYINRLWFGEYFDYEKGSPEFYLTEVSGIPFGLMGEMLQDGGNPWRGMLYGMTNRMPYQKLKPDHIWKAWDDFGIMGSRMIGYWVSDNPVKTTHESVLATVYQKEGKVMVSLASWAESDVNVKLDIDWVQLGIDPKKAKITAPEIKNFQPAANFDLEGEIPVKMNQGWMLIID
ncbi:glycoside hydrolase domain-containing protein [Echinicola shivajiensis]|uniref:glycoside hydrolase domain-containing protein n=1 Tax=Echinicola shivajiensis TaxID=1035916 RepID=UPI001FE69C33|nr:glycoside hydrolase domain-containing protein [Echinicola shivajiensis]